MIKIDTIEDLQEQVNEFIKNTAIMKDNVHYVKVSLILSLMDAYKRIIDWVATGSQLEHDYVKTQLKYVEKLLNVQS